MMEPIGNRYEFVFFFDVENGNPNGAPDAGGMPRTDPETGLGIVTDTCLKRKIRNYVDSAMNGEPGYDIYIREGVPLNRSMNAALEAQGSDIDGMVELKASDPELDRKLTDWMCSHYFDIRTFGGVMPVFTKACLFSGQIRGPVQLSFARSVEPVVCQDVTLTRITVTSESDRVRKIRDIGHKYIIPYGLYRCEGFISANIARNRTGFSEGDLDLLWNAIVNMFEDDRSANRGKMYLRKLFVFRHASALGNSPAWKQFETIHAERVGDSRFPARNYSDYRIYADRSVLADKVECIEIL